MVTFDWNWLKLRPRGTWDGIEVKVFDVASCVKEEFHFLHSNILTSPLGKQGTSPPETQVPEMRSDFCAGLVKVSPRFARP